MHKRNKLFVTIALAYGLLGGLLVLARFVDPTLVPGNVPRIHAHMMLSTDNRWFISTAMIWCIASGAWIAWHGALVTYGPAREIGVHLFGAGFLLSLIFCDRLWPVIWPHADERRVILMRET